MSDFEKKQDIIEEDIEVENVDTTPEKEGEYEDSDPVMQEPFDPSKINIIPKQDSLRNLIDRIEDDAIDMNTDFQRHAELWDNPKMSRLIESILIRFPLPAFYFDASNEDNWLIVDGLQRLSAIRKFVVDQKLKLHGLEYLKDFKNFSYNDLPKTYKRRINECPVTLFLIQPGTPDAVKYSIFRRINTGGIVLNDQEIRNAMAKPIIRQYLENLAKNEYFIKTIGDQSRRMVDQEMLLRYLSFRFMNYEQSKKNIAPFLDEMMNKLQESSQKDLDEFRDSFQLAIKRCWEIFGNRAFEKSTDGKPAKRRRKNSTLFEVWMNALSKISVDEMQVLNEKKQELVQKHLYLMANDNDYFRSITYSTQKKDHYRIRRNKVQQLIREILNAEDFDDIFS
ncbi:protein containing DUF262 [Candidatus Magnetomorum sp. HK-1]|nr:protein containing DUF262 [Candidatus Magnetomorum sp. HK-1]